MTTACRRVRGAPATGRRILGEAGARMTRRRPDPGGEEANDDWTRTAQGRRRRRGTRPCPPLAPGEEDGAVSGRQRDAHPPATARRSATPATPTKSSREVTALRSARAATASQEVPNPFPFLLLLIYSFIGKILMICSSCWRLQMETVRLDFAFFDPKPTGHPRREATAQHLPRFQASSDLILEQTTVSTIIKNSRWPRTKRRMGKQMRVASGTVTMMICSVSLRYSISEETGYDAQ